MQPKFSLIISTIERTGQLAKFIEHLDKQTFRNFKLIIVDQNDDKRLDPILNNYRGKLVIEHFRSAKGVSRGRNKGRESMDGDFVTFPDDDCWYKNDLLERVVDIFLKNPDIDVISGRTINSQGHTSLGRFDKRSGRITKRNVFKRGNTNTLFFRREVVERIAFDEDLGPGAGTKWGSADESDYILKALQAGYNIFYFHNLTIFHENPIAEYDAASIKRGYYYGCGMGRVFKKHGYSFIFVFLNLFYRLGGMFLSLIQMDIQQCKYHWAVFKGRLEGWMSEDK